MRELRKLRAPIIYMFNTKTQEGFETTRAIFAFLADRYSGKNHNSNYAKISNWILGNEINNQIWNYMGPADFNTYVSTYQQAFRTSTRRSRAQVRMTGFIFHLISGGELRMRT